MDTTIDTAPGLRAWAKGLYPTEAAVELLIRTNKHRAGQPWIFKCDDTWEDRADWYGVDFERIPDNIGWASGGERRILLIAASLGSGQVNVNLNDALPGMDREHVRLVLAAMAHANGSHEGREFIVEGDTFRLGDPYEALYPWPEVTE